LISVNSQTVQVYEVVIKASPERIWEAITKPECSVHYFHGARIENTADRHISHGPDGSLWGDGPVTEWDPPHRLAYEWHSLYDPDLAAEPGSRVTWTIEPIMDGECRLTLVHDQLENSPKTAASVSGPGWSGVLNALKTYVES
jgi:uncharacterized protein YndB with AHSA1/START domain